MKTSLLLLVLSAFIFVSCSVNLNRENQNSNAAPPKTENSNPGASGSANKIDGKSVSETGNPQDLTEKLSGKNQCSNIDTGDKTLLKSQTFPIDFAPFRNSCFVTAHNPEYDDPPIDSEFSIYKDGEQVFMFPSQFNGVTFGCWVEAVSFEDLNNDNLTDIIVAGLCCAKSDSYSENMIYVNNGSGFNTNEEANYQLNDFKKIKDISNFAKQNQNIFFR